MIIVSAAGYAESSGHEPVLARFRDGRISVHASGTPFLKLVEEISRKGNLKIYMVDQALPDSVSVNITDLPVEQALGRIFNGCNYAVVYGAPEAAEGSVYIGHNFKPIRGDHAMVESAKEGEKVIGRLKEKPGEGSLRQNKTDVSFQEERAFAYSGEESPDESTADTGGSESESGDGDPLMPLSMNNTVPEEQEPAKAEEAEPGSFAGELDSWKGISGSPGNNIESVSLGNYIKNSPASGSEAAAPGFISGEDSEIASGISADPSSEEKDSPANDAGDISSRERFLISQIYILEGQIDSGYAERWYEHWSQVKDPKYIQTHEEKLSYYKSELEKFRNQ